MDGLLKAYGKVALEDIGRPSIAQDIFERQHGLFWDGSSLQQTEWEELLCRAPARIAAASLCMTACGGYRRDTGTATIERRNIAIGGAQHAKANTNGGATKRCNSEPTQTERKSSKRAQHRWACVTTWSMR